MFENKKNTTIRFNLIAEEEQNSNKVKRLNRKRRALPLSLKDENELAPPCKKPKLDK